MSSKKLYIVANCRMPAKKAYGIQLAKMCEAFVESGYKIVLVIPNTKASQQLPMQTYYTLRVPVPTKVVFGMDWYASGKLGFVLSSLVCLLSSAIYIGLQQRKKDATAYVVDMDGFSFIAALGFGMPYVVEVDRMPTSWLGRKALRRASGVVAINSEVKKDLISKVGIDASKIIVSPNGVEPAWHNAMSSHDARALLSLPLKANIAMYVGRFYAWKGLEILVSVAQQMPDVTFVLVGGTEQEFTKITGLSVTHNMQFAGLQPNDSIPAWQSAADVLLVLGTAKNQDSYRYTAPMKVFEYMTSGRPVVAAKTPAIQSLVPDNAVLWYQPDASQSLVVAITKALAGDSDVQTAVQVATRTVQEHSWLSRAQEISVLL
jgi:glycosyltransferase involved in cell wall biosynthesis